MNRFEWSNEHAPNPHRWEPTPEAFEAYRRREAELAAINIDRLLGENPAGPSIARAVVGLNRRRTLFSTLSWFEGVQTWLEALEPHRPPRRARVFMPRKPKTARKGGKKK